MEVRGNTDYFGSLYIGDDYRENRMVYDTMSDYTIVVSDQAEGTSIPGNYAVDQSTTASQIQYESSRGDTTELRSTTDSVNLGSVIFNGLRYKDQVCIKQQRGARTTESGTFCIKD